MKNLVLALLLALGVSNVSAAATVASVEAATVADVEAIINDVENVDAQTKFNVIKWAKAHPAIVGAVVTTLVATGVYTYAVVKAYTPFEEGKEGTGYKAAFKAPYDWAADKATNAGESIKTFYNEKLELAKANPKTTAACGVGAAVLVAVLVDLMRGDKSYLQNLCSTAKADVAATAAGN